MPCWEVNLVDVAFQAKSIPLLRKALEALGWPHVVNEEAGYVRTRGFTIDLDDEKARIDANKQYLLNELKVAYSTEVVKATAAKRRWVLIKQRSPQRMLARRY